MLYHRTFKDYHTYRETQGFKARTNKEGLLAKAPNRIKGFQKAFSVAKPHMKEGNILCLGARTGCEVIGAENAGFVGSMGVDLHPIGKNVIEADWASLPFDDSFFDNVFTNSIDHVSDLDAMISESKRVIKPDGIFFLLVPFRIADKAGPNTLDNWLSVAVLEGLYWDDPQDVADRFIDFGFVLNHHDLKGKWNSYFLKCVK